MIDWLFPSTAERRLLGAKRLRGATPWVIAIMSFTIVIVAVRESSRLRLGREADREIVSGS